MFKNVRIQSILIISIIFLCLVVQIGCHKQPQPQTPAKAPATEKSKTKISRQPHAHLILFIMPKCIHCAQLLKTILPLREELKNDILLSFGFIGPMNLDDEGQLNLDNDGARSAEIELCAGITHKSPAWYKFMECLYMEDAWQQLPSQWQSCATKSEIDPAAVNACIENEQGKEELTRSMLTAAKEGITAAPALFINGQFYMGEPTRGALLKHICFATGNPATRPALCKDIPQPTPIAATLLFDERCDLQTECNVEQELSAVKSQLTGLTVTPLAYASAEGRSLYDDIVAAKGPKHLPILVIHSQLTAYPTAKTIFDDYLMPFSDGYLLPFGKGFDPTVEICDNDIDDDNNAQTDCADASCAQTLHCRKPEKNRLDLFLMSQCPFGMELMPVLKQLVDHFERDKSQLNLNIQFIGDVIDGELDSMHGPSEVAEDLRMVCIQNLYPKNYQFLDYMNCRSKRYFSNEDWQACLTPQMSRKKVEACANGEKGRALLTQSFLESKATDSTASPSWLLNNTIKIDERTAEDLLNLFCDHNTAAGCTKKMKPQSFSPKTDQPQSCE